MDEAGSFTSEGNIQFTVPLKANFEKTLFEFVQLVARKSGYNPEAASQIAQSVSEKVFRHIPADETAGGNHQVHLWLAHRTGQLTVRTELPELNISEVEEF